jgi:hypothetical protein
MVFQSQPSQLRQGHVQPKDMPACPDLALACMHCLEGTLNQLQADSTARRPLRKVRLPYKLGLSQWCL